MTNPVQPITVPPGSIVVRNMHGKWFIQSQDGELVHGHFATQAEGIRWLLEQRAAALTLSVEQYRRAAKVFYDNSAGCTPGKKVIDELAAILQVSAIRAVLEALA